MAGAGEILKQARESRGLLLEEVAQATRIRVEYLVSIEAEQYTKLPGDVYTRGFLRNYAGFLGIDSAEVIAAYEARNDPPRKRVRSGAPPPPPPQRRPEAIHIQPLSPTPVNTRVRYAPSFWLMGLLAFVLLIVSYLGYNAYTGASRLPLATPTVTARTTPTQLIGLPTVLVGSTVVLTTLPTPGPSPVPSEVVAGGAPPPATPGQPANPPSAATPVGGGQPGQVTPTVLAGQTPGNGVTVQVTVGSQNAWMKVDIDGKTAWAATLAAGTVRSWSGKNVIRIRFARADITSVNVNGVDKGRAGDSSQTVVTKEWDAAGNERVIP
ncbi:MAG TPA: RodZ domain-containing protein [Chloroflexia bacterium]|nr:RodZ domain-containing protein [Chloroflexia bacterium]